MKTFLTIFLVLFRMAVACASDDEITLPPKDVQAVYSAATIILCAWDCPIQNAKYEVYSRPDGEAAWKLRYTTSVVDLNYEKIIFQSCSGYGEGKYWLRVRAVHATTGLPSDYSPEVSVIVPPFGVPTGFQSTTYASARLMLQWQDVSNESSYEVWRQIGSEWSLYRSFAADTRHSELTGLPANTTFSFKLRAVGSEGPSEFTEPITARTYRVPQIESVAALPDGLIEYMISGEVTGSVQLHSYIQLSSDLKSWLPADLQAVEIDQVATSSPTEHTQMWRVRLRDNASYHTRFLKLVMPEADYATSSGKE